MKKSILLIAFSLSLGVVLISCKEEKKETPKENNTEMQENHAADKADMAMKEVYQCPMGCSDGKTYDKEGKCPICNMTLKKVKKTAKDGTEGDGHDHDHGETNTKTEG